MEGNVRVLTIEKEYCCATGTSDPMGSGSVSEFLRVHGACRTELHGIVRREKETSTDGSNLNPQTSMSMVESVALLQKMGNGHSRAGARPGMRTTMATEGKSSTTSQRVLEGYNVHATNWTEHIWFTGCKISRECFATE